MSVTSGFFNSLHGDRKYYTEQVSQLFDGVILDGVFMSVGNCFAVQSGEGMHVKVLDGRAWFNHTWTMNDSILVLDVPDSDAVLTRIDAVVLEVNDNESVRENSIKMVKGISSADPKRPTMKKEDHLHQYPLAYITVNPGVLSIGQESITNAVGSSECPFVVGVNKTMDIDLLLAQWDAAGKKMVSDWENSSSKALEEWETNSNRTLSDWENNAAALLDKISKELADLNAGTAVVLKAEKGQPGGVASLGNDGKVPKEQMNATDIPQSDTPPETDDLYWLDTSETDEVEFYTKKDIDNKIGKPNGICPLGPDGKIPLEYGGGVPITLTANVETGSTVTATQGATVLTQESAENKAVFNLPKAGFWNVKAEKDGKQATERNISVKDSYDTSLFYVEDILNNNSWKVIHEMSNRGLAESFWSVGDTKNIIINGRVGNTNFDNLAIDVFIIGFNHNAEKEGNNLIHFQIGKIDETAVALCDSKYGKVVSGGGYFSWNTSNTNVGGWEGCYKRKTLYGNTNKPTSPLSGSLMVAFPEDLRKIIQPVIKYTDNTGNSSNVSNHVTATTDYLWDLSEFEVQGARTYANKCEQNSQQQYQYYKAGNPKIAYNHTSTVSAVWWGLRSAYYSSSYEFCYVYTDGSPNYYIANYSGGLRPGFAV